MLCKEFSQILCLTREFVQKKEWLLHMTLPLLPPLSIIRVCGQVTFNKTVYNGCDSRVVFGGK